MKQRLAVVATVARDPTLARLEVAYLGSNMAEHATWIAILVYAYGLGGASMAALFALVMLIPSAIVAPIVATIGDRVRRDRLLLGGYAWQSASMAATAGAIYAGAPDLVTLGVATIAALSVTVHRPAQSALLPELTHSPAELTAANGVSGLAENLGLFLGPLVAGLLLARSEPADVFAFFAVVTLAAAVLVARLPGGSVAASEGRMDGLHDVIAATVDGVAAIRRSPSVMVLVAILASMTVVIGALDILLVAVAIDLLGAGESWAGYLYAAVGLGGVIGALATVALVGRRRLTPALAAGGSVFGLPIAAIAFAPSALAAPLLLLATGGGASYAGVAGRTMLQRVAPTDTLARVFGFLEGLDMVALALGSVVTGAVIAWLGVGGALLVVGAIVPVVLIIVWRRLDVIDRDAPAPDPDALALLQALPIFAPLSAPAMERILADREWLEVDAGKAVITEGEVGDRFYVIASGRVTISVRGTPVREQGPGEGFGEIALLRNVRRTATATALSPLRLLAIDRDVFLGAVTGHPHSHERAEALAAERIEATPGETPEPEPEV